MSRTHRLKRLYKVGLTARVESSDNEESLGEDASKQGRIDDIDVDEEIILVSVQNVNEEMFDVNVLNGEEVFVAEQEVAVKDVSNVVSTVGDAITISAATTTTTTITTVDDITLAQALMEIKSTKPKEKGVVIQELGESTTTISSPLSSQQSHDKGKGILIEHNRVGGRPKKRNRNRDGQEITKKQKVEDDKEIAELKQLMKIIPDEEVAIDAILLVVKSPSIVGWKIYKEGRKSYYQIMRVDGKYQNIYMLVEKKYPLAPLTLSMMLEKKLNIDYESEMAYQLLKFIVKQLKKIVGIKSLLDAVRITAAHVCVNVAQLDLVLLMNFKENMLSVYYC
ncbi:hypothetical protein Tco_1483780 [Tanacetum coccineum]